MTVTVPPEPIRTLAPRYHVDGNHHVLEMDRVFARTWQYARHEAGIAERNAWNIPPEGLGGGPHENR